MVSQERAVTLEATATVTEPLPHSRPPTPARHQGTRPCLILLTHRRYAQERELRPTSSILGSSRLRMPTPASLLLLGGGPRSRTKVHTVIAEDTTKSDTPRRLAGDLLITRNTAITHIKHTFASLILIICIMRTTLLIVTICTSGTIHRQSSSSTPAAFPKISSFPG